MIVVGESEDVPPLSNSNSYVYVARTVDGWFYVGETDNLRARIATHRRNSRFGGKGVAFICQDVPLGGKSTARRVEAAGNNALQYAATLCNTLQHSATLGNTREHSATHAELKRQAMTYYNTL